MAEVEPLLQGRGLAWEDMPFDMIDEVSEIKAAAEDLDAFMKRLAEAGGPVARKLLLGQLRPRLEPPLRTRGLAWEDALPLFETLDTLDEVRAAVDDLDAFLKRLTNAGGAGARKLVLAKLRPRLEPPLAARGLQWEDALCVLEAPQALELVEVVAKRVLHWDRSGNS